MLAPFDVWDRYDFDHDGNFDEPDGYIDHFQSVHAGEGEETGGGAQGTDAIWSHRSYANGGAQGVGPVVGGARTRPRASASATAASGSATTPSSPRTAASACSRTSSAMTSASPTSTTPAATPVVPRTAPPGGPSGRRAPTARSTVSTSGRRRSTRTPGTSVSSAGLNYDVVTPARTRPYKLGQPRPTPRRHRRSSSSCPTRRSRRTSARPLAGTQYYFSGAGNDLDNTMTRSRHAGAGPATLSSTGRWNIETGWDYAYLMVDRHVATVPTTRTRASLTDGQNFERHLRTSGQPHVGDADLPTCPRTFPDGGRPSSSGLATGRMGRPGCRLVASGRVRRR